jgi:DNA invertase Pin-like site-specific DNA recombinase
MTAAERLDEIADILAPASRPRKSSTWSSTASMLSVRLARPTWRARRLKGGCSSPTATTTGASAAAPWTAPLQRLIGDIEARRVDVVVVYKIDRLSRSLMDFAKLVEVFDRNNVTFVSVTQSFNTTTSMGRLTLNILLSLAQFEREVIGRTHPRQIRSVTRGVD